MKYNIGNLKVPKFGQTNGSLHTSVTFHLMSFY